MTRVLIVSSLVFIQIGFVYFSLWGIACGLHRRLNEVTSVATALCLFALASIAVFWLSWAFPNYQAILRILIILVMATCSVAGLLRGSNRAAIGMPFFVAALVATALFLIVHLPEHSAVHPLRQAATLFTHELPGDNEIPMVFADAILKGNVPSPLYGEWLSSDRPPLQTGMYLLSPVVIMFGSHALAYQALAIAVQMFVLVGVWSLARAMQASRNTTVLVMIAVTFTPIAIVNGIFVWPKLLAAGFVALAVAVHFYGKRQTGLEGLIVGVACAMALLAHGSAIFTLVAMFVAALLLWKLGSTQYVIAAGLSVLILYSPWVAYQTLVDPPGDRLVKWHFAGVGINSVDPRPFSTALSEAYSHVTFTDWVLSREQAFQRTFIYVKENYSGTLSAANSVLVNRDGQAAAKLAVVRSQQFFGVIISCGLIGLAFVLIPLGLFEPTLKPLSLIVGLNLIFWWAILFDPLGVTVHQGSYFPEVAIIVGFIVFLANRWPRIAVGIVGAQVAITTFQYAI